MSDVCNFGQFVRALTKNSFYNFSGEGRKEKRHIAIGTSANICKHHTAHRQQKANSSGGFGGTLNPIPLSLRLYLYYIYRHYAPTQIASDSASEELENAFDAREMLDRVLSSVLSTSTCKWLLALGALQLGGYHLRLEESRPAQANKAHGI